MWKNKNNITLYLVTDNLENNLENLKNKTVLTITAKKDQADEFIIKKLFKQHYEHFSL